MTIYSQEFDGNATAGKYRTIAHEIGHVYGLGHVDNYSNQIMYPYHSTTKNVTTYDIAGMNVMTHTHTHNGSYPGTYVQLSGYQHIKRCSK
ncbi:MAG: matrixin family metalloprotease [Clostridia bacterium]|nr:matrixin family metalloprotease [Clostridia bacterium]